ncbi:putative aldouronate transport system permease protein [Paenibacillus phyllosphaerae]|uniref:Putative aldouronate transport system permease protein n=1 Tax=Paenibacillus phyllosphaerae TaxID=274593 RepID=A0A7W5AVI3_9BACL|nr:ABC transporter permease subunit [Paenibacillus phyllosphaerae]MBB3109548.1 putative aldouronate transport system permease protein [Paenibacillus phyllosphaerae]
MEAVTGKKEPKERGNRKSSRFWRTFLQQKYLYMMSLPFVIWVFVFSYVPLWGWTMAFQKYKPMPTASLWDRVFDQKWVGFDQFQRLFTDDQFYLVLRNTLAMSFMGLIAGFVVPIVFAVLLNEVKNIAFKRVAQTISYLPHFVSWVVVAGIVIKMLSTDNGAVNDLLMWLGIIDEPYQFMAKEKWFWGIVTAADVWKETGWNTIIYLAAMAGISSELYEAARVDGASRLRQIWHITLPGIRSTIVILLIMSIGHLVSIGFEKQFLLSNNLVSDYAQVLDLYALQYGLQMSNFSYGTAINVFNSVVGIILLFSANGIFKKITKESIM